VEAPQAAEQQSIVGKGDLPERIMEQPWSRALNLEDSRGDIFARCCEEKLLRELSSRVCMRDAAGSWGDRLTWAAAELAELTCLELTMDQVSLCRADTSRSEAVKMRRLLEDHVGFQTLRRPT
jgi:hypothetical protein